jgi:hypothetical protein
MAAVTGRLPAGPELRQRPPLTLRGQPGVEVTAPLSVAELGFSLHAATQASCFGPQRFAQNQPGKSTRDSVG